MADITVADKNFVVQTNIDLTGFEFRSVLEPPFSIHGVYYDGDRFRRMPENAARATSQGVLQLHANTAGGRVRFVTDAKFVVIKAVLDNVARMSHFSLTGTASLDMYVKTEDPCDPNGAAAHIYSGTFIPPYGVENAFISKQELFGSGMRTVTIDMPIYSDLMWLEIGLPQDAKLEAAPAYKYPGPVVYYGSSITQGGCASRPGNTYQEIISRALDLDYVNLGFSGSAKAEDPMIEYLADLEMSAFVLDYDYNAPNLTHLQNTHEKLFMAVRKAHPDMPILITSRPRTRLLDWEERRKECVETTYKNAVARGDKNVWYIPGDSLIPLDMIDMAKVDGGHPNDLGFMCMAKTMEPVIREMLKI